MKTRRLVALAALLALATPAMAGPSGPVTVRGTTYPTWSDYFRSDYFRTNGLRCGTRDPFANRSATGLSAEPGDCSMDLTNPSEEYAPGRLVEITVVVHRLESLTGDGVYPDSMVRTQIDVLNEDYQALPGSPGEPGADIRIRFKLATRDPAGNPSPGWTRTTNEFWFNDLPDPINGAYYDALAWDPHRYLNIYTLSPVAPGGVVLGYVPFFPQEGGAGTNEDGVRCLWNAFGRRSPNAPFDLGRTVTHEVGHYLGLYHTFQDGCGTGSQPACYSTGDRICDTEPDSESHGGCPTDAATCGDPDPIRNYMEYTDDACMNNFTAEQARRVVCTMRHYRPVLAQEVAVAAVNPAAAAAALALRAQPNPLRFGAEISFRLAAEGEVSLVVTDVAGRARRTLVRSRMSAGEHSLRWDGNDDEGARLAPGVYFGSLSTDQGGTRKRLVVLR